MTITTGPAGSSFRRTAERCQKTPERDGVTLKEALNKPSHRRMPVSSGSICLDSGVRRNSLPRTRSGDDLVLNQCFLKILPSDGLAENLRRLADPKQQIDVGFVLSSAA